MPTLMTPKEVAARLGLSVTTLAIWRCTQPGRLPYIKLGNRTIRYDASDVETFLMTRSVGKKETEN